MNRKNLRDDAPLLKVRVRWSTSVTMEKSRCERVSPTIGGRGRHGSLVDVGLREVNNCVKSASRVPGTLCSWPHCLCADNDKAFLPVPVRLPLRGGGMPATVKQAFFFGGGPSGLDNGVFTVALCVGAGGGPNNAVVG